ncbi:hypothetical protein ACFYXH_08850 [Streptomyces sp. NPDC002730]|uniref:hypothetical protein n=1 Tax=Streptomyces sp. NPDC002730 TaxID=3364662 RepID=UPI00368F1445
MGFRYSTGAPRRSAGLPRFLGALAVITTVLTAVVLQGQAMADTVAPANRGDHSSERLWLLGGLALSLTAAGVIAVAATRGRRNH